MATSRCLAIAIVLAGGGQTLSGRTDDPVGSRPNVLMIAIDDLRPMLGCYGDATVISPHIDALAARGMRFDRAYCQLAKCGPSRLSILTGLRPDSIGVSGHRDEDLRAFRDAHPDLVSLPRWFRQHGYETRGFGKVYHDGWDDPRDWSEPAEPGRDGEMLEIVDESAIAGVPFAERAGVPTIIADRLDCPAIQAPDVPDETLFAGRMTSRVIGLMRDREAGADPFFFAVGYRRPHLPFVAPKSWFDRYRPDPAWLPPANRLRPPEGAPLMAWFNSDGYVGTARNQGLTMPVRPGSIAEGMAWAGYELRSYRGIPNQGPISAAEQLAVQHAYRACISYVDGQVGRLTAELASLGLEDDTIVVLWSDHGWHLGEQGAWSKMTNYEVATRVPFIVAAPGGARPAGGSTRSLVELVDLFPTLCDLAGLPRPGHLEGESLVPVLEDPSAVVRAFARSQFPRFRDRYLGRSWRNDRYRLVEWTDTRSGKVVERELYDHEADPGETRNLAREVDAVAVFGDRSTKK